MLLSSSTSLLFNLILFFCLLYSRKNIYINKWLKNHYFCFLNLILNIYIEISHFFALFSSDTVLCLQVKKKKMQLIGIIVSASGDFKRGPGCCLTTIQGLYSPTGSILLSTASKTSLTRMSLSVRLF